MKQIIMLNTALYAERIHKETKDDSAGKIVDNFNRWEKKVVVVDEDDETKDVHYAVKDI